MSQEEILDPESLYHLVLVGGPQDGRTLHYPHPLNEIDHVQIGLLTGDSFRRRFHYVRRSAWVDRMAYFHFEEERESIPPPPQI